MFRYLAFAFYALSISTATAQRPDFQPLAVPLHEFRGGGHAEVMIRFTPTAFQVMRLTESELSAGQARPLVAKDASLPRLRFTRTGLWIAHEVSRNVTIDEPVGAEGAGDTTRKWKKAAWTAIGTYQRTAWPQFVEFALSNGLSGIEELRYQGVSWFTLSLAPLTPGSFEGGGHRISLNPDFGAQMRFSPKYPAIPGNKGFVILLHDPHQNVAGRFQTLSGLRSLISANPSTRFRFLVEGRYEEPSRQIGLSGLDGAIKASGETRATVIYSLLSRFMINTPLAYRLLYDQQMSAYAIDDNELLKYDAPPSERSRLKQETSIRNIAAVLQKPNVPLSAEDKSQFLGALSSALIYVGADLADVPDEQVVKYYKDLAGLYRTIVSAGTALANAGAPLDTADLQGLANDATSCAAQQNSYQKALKRNETMIREIIPQSRSASAELPVAFIGSYHTSGITIALEAAGVGYVVIEPRPMAPPTEAENEAFDQANYGNLRSQYLDKISLYMGYTGPTAAEVRKFYVPKIDSKIPEVTANRLAIERDFRAVQGSVVDTGRLTSVMDNNGSLAGVLISSGGNKPPPPGEFGQAFAYIEPGDGPGRKLQLVLGDPRDARWKEWDRYSFLRNAQFKPPELRAGVTSGVNFTFYTDSGSNRLFFTFYEPKSKRTYCFEGDPHKAAAFVPMPNGSKSADYDMRMQVVELIWRARRKNG